MNGTQPSSCPSSATAVKIGMTFACCLILIVALTGNTVIGIIVYKTKTMRKPINFFIVNMAMSDLVFPLFLIPSLIQTLYTNSWLIGGLLGQVLCKLEVFLPITSSAVSIQSLVLIAVDRFGAVVFPLRSPLISSRMCPFFILATCIVAIAVNSPYFVAGNLVEYPEGLSCERLWNEAFGKSLSLENYRMPYFVVFIFIPLVLIAILYITIYLKLKSQEIPGEQSANAGQQRQQREQRERNVLKMAIAIVLGFAVCWLPVTIFDCIVHITDTHVRSSCGVRYYVYVGRLMAIANSAINPCICLIFSRSYRNGLKALFR